MMGDDHDFSEISGIIGVCAFSDWVYSAKCAINCPQNVNERNSKAHMHGAFFSMTLDSVDIDFRKFASGMYFQESIFTVFCSILQYYIV